MLNHVETLQIFCTVFMVGLIWFVQVVHYPLFKVVGDSSNYFREHQKRTSWVVLPVMLLELVCAAFLLYYRGIPVDQLGFVLVAVIWISTLFFQIPCHQKLLTSYSEKVVLRLVRTNWVRTLGWSIRAVILLATY